MDIIEFIKSRRTIRFFSPKPIPRDAILKILDCARSAPSAANRQPVEYIIVDKPEVCDSLFQLTAWAGYVQPKRNPTPGKQPVAYIAVLTNPELSSPAACAVDAAAAIENILLAAWSMNIGSAWLGAIQRDQIKSLLNIPDSLAVDSVVALGYPAENPVMEDLAPGADIKYYLDSADRLHVPKRTLDSIVHDNAF